MYRTETLGSRAGYALPGAISFFPALALFVLLGSEVFVKTAVFPLPPVTAEFEMEEAPPEEAPTFSASLAIEGASPGLGSEDAEQSDLILECWRNEQLREEVEEFFAFLTGNRETARVILSNASRFNLPPSLAFALCWEESRFKTAAVNRKNLNKTVDRGLFQLNDASFPNLEEDDFFDPALNAYYGLSHLKWCIDTAGTEVAALAMYNAGTGRVREGGAPKHTLDYVSRILKNQRSIETRFRKAYGPPPAAAEEEEEEIIPSTFVLALLTPLGR